MSDNQNIENEPKKIKLKETNKRFYLQSAVILLTANVFFVAFICVLVFLPLHNVEITENTDALNSVWSWECEQSTCRRKRIGNNTETALSLPACRLFCSETASLWPKPSEEVVIGSLLTKINVNNIEIRHNAQESRSYTLFSKAAQEFKKDIEASMENNVQPGGKTVIINLIISNTSVHKLTLDTDESYQLEISEPTVWSISVNISAITFFGARHGLQTLSQLIIFDDLRNELQIPTAASITDKPAFPHRGIMLDTSRNYVTVDVIKGTLKAMGASKLNTFHWHITDSHSFPYVSKSHPELSKLGAYSPSKVYTAENIRDIVEYGKARGVRVIPEFDAPAHVGEGWQDTGLVVCLNSQPWQDFCVEPPCGQFDPTQDKLYDVLEDIYGDMLEQFDPDVFHMGGDEVKFTCWNTSTSIVQWMTQQGLNRTENDFQQLWSYFQNNAHQRLYKRAGREIPIILWTSGLTEMENVSKLLPKEKYIIQIWTTKNDSQITKLLDEGYKIILSNYDALYMDCGFGGWVTSGNNWCSPYIGWQKVYENKPEHIAGSKVNQVLGGETALWTEQADTASIDSRLWPRSAALAEVLWTNPSTNWEQAEERFLIHRERLLALGINADAIVPEWCMLNEENCRIGSKHNKPYLEYF